MSANLWIFFLCADALFMVVAFFGWLEFHVCLSSGKEVTSKIKWLYIIAWNVGHMVSQGSQCSIFRFKANLGLWSWSTLNSQWSPSGGYSCFASRHVGILVKSPSTSRTSAKVDPWWIWHSSNKLCLLHNSDYSCFLKKKRKKKYVSGVGQET